MGNYVNPTSTVRKFGQLHSQPNLLVTTFTATLIQATTTSDLDDCSWFLQDFLLQVFQHSSTEHINQIVSFLCSEFPVVPHLTQKESSECSARPLRSGFPLFLSYRSSLAPQSEYTDLTYSRSASLIPPSPLNLCTDVAFSTESTLMILLQTAASPSSPVFQTP